jgi:hypothetical protein
MTILHINNRFIVPLKCGSRFLRKNNWETNGVTILDDGWENFKNRNWDVMILRNPIDHLKSALHTELLSLWNNHKRNPLDYLKGLSHAELSSLWNDDKNYSKYNESELIYALISELGTPHWCGTLNKILYEIWVDKDKKPKPLKLENLSLFLSLENIDIPEYRRNQYNFKYFDNWETPEYIFNYVKNKYPNELDIMLEMANNDEIYYNKFDFLKFEKKIL